MSISFGSHGKPRAKRARPTIRRTFSATYTGELIMPKRGAWTRSIDAVGDVIEDGHDTRASLIVNIGDELILFGPGVEQIAIVEVVSVESGGWSYRVKTVFWIEAVPAGEVFVMRRKTK